MERAVVVGNCQAKALELLLNTNEAFAARFEFVSFPAVHEIPDELVPELHRAVAGAALLIVQRVDEGYRDGVGLGTETLARVAGGAMVLRWPSVYWAGYVPDLFYLRDAAGGPVVDGPFDYHDRVILEAYAAGEDVARTCALLADPERPSGAAAWAAQATAELDVRGRDCQIQVASYIAERFREQLLFFTMNHPANQLLGHMAQQVVQLLALPGRVDVGCFVEEVLGSTFYPLHVNHVRALGLTFGAGHQAGTCPFKIRGVAYEAPAAVAAFFDYYAAHPQLVELNLAAVAP
ncbi:MAG: WcbI family polysaccharide biosynthesis putative acetyltransferase [Conexibacter sp.]